VEFEYIDNDQMFTDYYKGLKESETDIIALDIEGESNLHEYGEKLCLIQIYDGCKAVLIDPFMVNQELLKKIIENRKIMKVMFDAGGDRAFLFKNNKMDILTILDLQVAVGLLGYEKRDLGSVLKHALNFDPGRSKKKFQKYNWTRRPLHKDAIQYALEDVTLLLKLKDHLLSEIISRGLFEVFTMKNIQVQNKAHIYNSVPGLLRSGQFRKLPKDQQLLFKKLFYIRDKYAQRINFPPHSLVHNSILFNISEGINSAAEINFSSQVPSDVKTKLINDINSELSQI